MIVPARSLRDTFLDSKKPAKIGRHFHIRKTQEGFVYCQFVAMKQPTPFFHGNPKHER